MTLSPEHETTTLTCPRTGRVRRTVTNVRAAGVAAAVRASRSALPRWSRLVPRERARRLDALATLIEDHAAEYALREQAGTGKPEAEARGEVGQAADLFRFYGYAARAALTPAAGRLIDGYESWVRWEPLGVVAAILPWNYPLLMAAWRCAPALAAGNVVLVKPAQTTPDSAELLVEHAAEALGAGVLTAVVGDRATGQVLADAHVDAVAFTGSLRGGTDVARRAGVKRVSLELGGNGPVVVLPDAPETSWADLAVAATYNAGQNCAAPARIITARDAYDDVVEKLTAALCDKHAGRDFGPLNNPDQAERHDRILDAAQAQGVRVSAVEPGAGEAGGYWRGATVLAGVPEDDAAVVEEVFAPVLTVQAADDLDHMVALANGQPQALAASVWSSDVTAAIDVATRINAGEVWINCHLVQTAELPHGGRGASGHGTDLSVLALQEYQRPKTITARLCR